MAKDRSNDKPVDDGHPPDDTGRVIPFRHRRSEELAKRKPDEPGDLRRFQHSGEPDDYRHRMMTNAAAVVVIAGLVALGLWMADSLARMRKDQDCVLSGRRNCANVEVLPRR